MRYFLWNNCSDVVRVSDTGSMWILLRLGSSYYGIDAEKLARQNALYRKSGGTRGLPEYSFEWRRCAPDVASSILAGGFVAELRYHAKILNDE